MYTFISLSYVQQHGMTGNGIMTTRVGNVQLTTVLVRAFWNYTKICYVLVDVCM